jgi:hypothetical protein
MTTVLTKDIYCNGLNKQYTSNDNEDKKYCKLSKGYLTNHPGEGRCIYHEDTIDGDLNQIKLIPYNIPSIKERQIEFLRDKDILSLDREIALSRTFIEVIGFYIEKLKMEQKTGISSSINIDGTPNYINVTELTNQLNKTIRTIANLVQMKNDIENGKKYVIHIEIFQNIVARIAEVIDVCVTDLETRNKINDGLKKISLPGV